WMSGWVGAANIIYRLDGDTMQPVWRSESISATTTLAFGDVNGDGYLDLAVGNRPEGSWNEGFLTANGFNELYLSQAGRLPETPALRLGEGNEVTTKVAFGDVDGDGDLDLAVGSHTLVTNFDDSGDKAPDKIYLNKKRHLSRAARLGVERGQLHHRSGLGRSGWRRRFGSRHRCRTRPVGYHPG
ncbi:MAG: FG-GAP repeat protein, partial [Anaerolineae bacterium]|nr:FG-GAP repeat protein [Anaerolineae bacterium]